ncbi:MAG: sigma-70 family RNA polymerase sigma factor [Nocardioidaceae bacterium]
MALRSSTDRVQRDQIRERITALNMCVAESVAHRYRGRGELEDDLEQVAYLGLIKAINGFDLRHHKDFLTYAVPTISGELKKHFRDHCWAVRPPRRIQDLQRRIAAASEELGQLCDHPPTTSEVAAALAVDTEEVSEALAASGCFTPASLDVGVGRADSTPVSDLIGIEDHSFAEAEAHVVVAPAVRELCDRDRDIIELRFFHDWTQERIAQELGITQMQVSRLITRIMRDLRTRLTVPAA